jgi:NADPH:quinone reductase-like Zn-dependent oxidoreductase
MAKRFNSAVLEAISKRVRMRAVRFHEHGGLEKLRFEEAPDPEPGFGEVVVRVRACALNYLDIWERRGLPGIRFPLPHISGSDVSGVIHSVGQGVPHLVPGLPVIVNPGLSCMHCPACFGGRDSMCRSYSVLGYVTDGGYAELVRIPAVNALPYPEGLDFPAAAAIPLVFMTAWHMLVTKCNLRPGEDVLVIGAGSGVGSAAIQVARLLGAKVIATAGAEKKLEAARALGAAEVINHSTRSIREEVRRITGKRGVDVVFEHPGAATWDDSLASLAAGGRLVTCGATTGYEARIDLRHLFSRQLTILGSYMGSKAELIEVLGFVRSGQLKPVISEVLPLGEAARAQAILERREQFGKVVLVP